MNHEMIGGLKLFRRWVKTRLRVLHRIQQLKPFCMQKPKDQAEFFTQNLQSRNIFLKSFIELEFNHERINYLTNEQKTTNLSLSTTPKQSRKSNNSTNNSSDSISTHSTNPIISINFPSLLQSPL
jgi:hypothetical protein